MTTRTLIEELKTEHKAFFESKLALYLIKNPQLFPTVQKTSDFIYTLLETHKDVVLNQIQLLPIIKEELYGEKYFGRLISDNEFITPLIIFNSMLQILKAHQNLAQIMQIHCVFAHRIYDKLVLVNDKDEFKKTMYPLLSPTNRGRVEKKKSSYLYYIARNYT